MITRWALGGLDTSHPDMNAPHDPRPDDRPSRARRVAVGAVKAFSVCWLVGHFALTVIHVMPINPLKNEVGPVADAVLRPLFIQNWSLFAPSPIQTNYSLLVRPLSGAEAASYDATGSLPEAGWYDLSSPLWARFQANRFSAYDRLTRIHSAAIRQWLSGGLDMVAVSKACQKGDEEACDRFADERADRQGDAGGTLAHTASSFCQDLAASGRACDRVALRIRAVGSVPWSERYTGSPDTVDVDVDVVRADPTAAPMHLFTFAPAGDAVAANALAGRTR